MNLYKQYLKERTNTDIVESEFGFATYTITNKDCYIEDIYIVKEKRKSYEASKLASKIQKIAIASNCTRLLGSVDLKANSPTTSMKALLGFGFKVLSSTENFIWFIINLK